MRIGFFWGPTKENRELLHAYRWSLRGFYFERNGTYTNVHYKALIGMYGNSWRIKLLRFKRAWKTVFTLGRS